MKKHPIGIIVAMKKEFDLLAASLTGSQPVEHPLFRMETGMRGNTPLVLMQCGIGKVNAAVGTRELIRMYTPSGIISTGVAGGIDASLRVGDVVIGSECVYHDVWCGEGNARGQVQGFPERFASCAAWQEKALAASGPECTHCGLICSGDRFITAAQELEQIKAQFPDGLAVDMESAAIAQVCWMSGTPFLPVRLISDTPGVENHAGQYERFWKEVPGQSFQLLTLLLDHITR